MKNKKRIINIFLVSFLLMMAVMTVVSRVMNESRTPEVETVSPASGNLRLPALGRGVVEYGKLSDNRIAEGVFEEDTLYVRGYFYDKAYAEGVLAGDEVGGGGKSCQGKYCGKDV